MHLIFLKTYKIKIPTPCGAKTQQGVDTFINMIGVTYSLESDGTMLLINTAVIISCSLKIVTMHGLMLPAS